MSGEPHWTVGSDPAPLFAAYLDFYREKAIDKVTSLSPEEQDTSRVPSVWTPLQLLHHLAHMEQRWFVWGFLAEPVAEPFGDEVDGVWGIPPDRGVARARSILHHLHRRRPRETHPGLFVGPTTPCWQSRHTS